MFRRILILKNEGVIAPYIMECFAKAFRRCGADVQVIESRRLETNTDEEFARIFSFHPEVVLGYGCGAIIEAEGQGVFRTLGIPVVLLFYDCPFFGLTPWIEKELQEFPDYYHHFVWDRAFISPYEKIIGRSAHKILLAADPEVFRPLPASDSFDLSFVGTSVDIAGIQNERRRNYPSQLNESLNTMIERKVNYPSIPLSKIWDQMYADGLIKKRLEWSDKENVSLYFRMHQEGSSSFRASATSTIQDVLKSSRIKVFSGQVDYFSELPKIYSDSKINLNFTSFQSEESVNSRIFDVGAAGGFLLTDYRADLERIFSEWKAISWASLEECVEKVRYFLAHAKEREELSQLLYKEILAEHTYVHRAQYIWDTLRAS